MTVSGQPGDDQQDIQRAWGRLASAPIFAGCLRDMPPGQCKILRALDAHANWEFKCSVGIERLANLTGLSERWVRACVRALEARGLLAVEVGGGKAQVSCYQISPEAAAAVLAGAAAPLQRPTPTKTQPKPAKARVVSGNDQVRRDRWVDRVQRMFADAWEEATPDQKQSIVTRWPGGFPDFLNAVGDEAAIPVFDEVKSDKHWRSRTPGAVAAELAALAREGRDGEATDL